MSTQSSFFFMQVSQNPENDKLVKQVSALCDSNKLQAYIIDRPLGEGKYSYSYESGLILLIPKHKIFFIDLQRKSAEFNEYVEDLIEDLGSIADKYRYKEFIGRPRSWSELYCKLEYSEDFNLEALLTEAKIENASEQRRCELLISLLTGSINDIVKVKAELPVTVLDQIKRKIVLFDGDQSRFIYQDLNKKIVRIQGLSGTGKTELLLHKLK